MIPLSNEETIKLIDSANNYNDKLLCANPYLRIDTSNLAISDEELDFFENYYSILFPGYYELSPEKFENKFKRVDTYTFKQIFSDNFNTFLNDNDSLEIDSNILDEVNKMISCQDPKNGYSLYECPDCHHTTIVPFTCKSRFCNTCSIKYQKDRSDYINSKLIRCPHRHLVFTIPEQLRTYFFNDHNLLNILFSAVNDCISYNFNRRAPRKNLIPGSVMVLHTFGRDLKWNPHIHCLVTEGATSNISSCPSNDIWINFTHFNYEGFRKSFQYCLLKLMKDYLKTTLPSSCFKKFTKLCDELYKNYDNGFYVRAKPFEGKSTDGAVNYLLRYFNRPAMAQSRILFYDGSYVVFYYQRHEDDMYVIEKVHVYDLIRRLIIHIPDKNFKMLRYAGIYSSHKCAHFDKLIKKMSEVAINTRKMLANWRCRIQASFHYDPLNCPHCHSTMKFCEIVLVKNTS